MVVITNAVGCRGELGGAVGSATWLCETPLVDDGTNRAKSFSFAEARDFHEIIIPGLSLLVMTQDTVLTKQ